MKNRVILAIAISIFLFFVISGSVSEQAGADSGAGLPDEKVSGFIDTWIGAQNMGNFDAYKALYAAGFKGIKRAGMKAYSYDLKGWLKDREKMFKKSMHVEARNVTAVVRNDEVEVTLVQVWESSGFKDMGPKLLRLKRDNGEYSIVYEEMLESIVLTAAKPSAQRALEFSFVIGGRCLVLEQVSDQELQFDLAETAPVLVSPDNISIAMKPLPKSKIPARYAELAGQTVSVFDHDGKYANATVTSVVLIAAGILHFGMIAYNEQMLGTGEMSEADVAAGIWDVIDDWGFFIAALVDFDASKIAGPLWATNKDPASIGFYTPVKGDRYIGAIGPGEVPPEMRTVSIYGPANGTRFVLDWQIEGTPCGEERFYDTTKIFRIETKGVKEVFSYSWIGMPLAAFDFNGNGVPDFIFWKSFDSFLLILDGKLERQITVPYHDCPC